MIIERIKSIVLLVLVSLSLLLTYQLWYGQKPTHLIAEEIYERVIVEKPRPLAEVITPAQIVVRTERGRYLMKDNDPDFYRLWAVLSQQLQDLDTDAIIVNQTSEESARNLLTVYMQPILPAGSDLPWLPDFPSLMIDKIEMLSLNDITWLTLSDSSNDTKTKLLLSPEQSAELRDLIAGIPGEDRIIYAPLTSEKLIGLADKEITMEESIYLPQEPVYLNSLIIKPEAIDRDLIIKTFFIDYNLARIIEEKDGGLIYTDGERGLRLTNVSLEYSHPRLESGQSNMSYPEALKNSSSLISYHGGWPVNLRLERLGLIRRGRSISYEAKWRIYYEGYPFYTNKLSRAIFNDRGLIHYTRSLFFVEDNFSESEERLPVADWLSALQVALEKYDEKQSVTQSGIKLEKIELGYVIIKLANAYRGEPVWFIQIDGLKFFLKAHNLDLINGEDML